MFKKYIRYFGLPIVFLFALTTHAEDLARLSIQNEVQLTIVKELVGTAHSRSGNDFIVSLDQEQERLLQRAGIKFEVFLKNIDINELSLVIPSDKPFDRSLDVSKLGDVIPLDNGLAIGTFVSVSASYLNEQSGYKVVPLNETEIRFYLIPEKTMNLIKTIEDFPLDSLADLVSQDSIYAFNTRLEAFQTRYIFTDSIDAARDWMVQKFLDWGYTQISTPTFGYGGDIHYNVMVVKPGYAEPDKVIVIGGHYDSIVYGQEPGAYIYAPGSDDDGSGTTVTLELARILADIPLRKTVIFMPFSAEEVGLVGSRSAAAGFVADDTELEVMYNFDMVGFTDDAIWDIDLMSGNVSGYLEISQAAAARVTSLHPVQVGLSGSSDHWSFHEQGFNICYTAESDFNTLGWHTNLDLTSRMNFPYLTEVVRMTAAALGVVANAAYPTDIESIVDMGDGQSLEINWADCNNDYDYTIYYGTSSGVYTDSMIVPPSSCSALLTGLTEGQRYYVTVVGEVAGGYPAVYAVEKSGRPLVVPLPPTNLNAEPEVNAIALNWGTSLEGDFAFYRVYRDDGSGFALVADNVTTPSYVDYAVVGHVEYTYKISSVDFDMNESNFSNTSISIPATFDGGLLLVDELSVGAPMPSQAVQELYFDTLMQGTLYSLYVDSSTTSDLPKYISGQYSSILWLDDDLNSKLISLSEPTLEWFTGYTNNICIAGFRTLSFWKTSPIATDDLLYREFGLSAFDEYDPFDFEGAVGQNGFPTVTVNTENVLGYLPFITTLTPRAGGEVIYRYNSVTDEPSVEGDPCGILYETINGKRVVLGFPLYYLTRESAQDLIAHLITVFGEETDYVPGDLNNSGAVDIVDITMMVEYMFNEGAAPLNMNSADVDGSCAVDIGDLVYMVRYVFASPSGPAPVDGCVF